MGDVDLSDAGKANCCVTNIEYSKFYIVWVIKNFTYCRQPKGEHLPSCIFSGDEAGSPKFRLDLYPRGTREYPDDLVIGIRLITDKEDTRSLVQYDCLIVRDGKAFHQQKGEFVVTGGRLSHPVTLVSREQLFSEKEELFPDDNLMLACAVKASFKEETGGQSKL